MHPIFVQIGSFPIHTYGVMLAVAVVVCAFLLSRDAAKLKISEDTVFDLMLWVVMGGFIGGKIFYTLLFWDNTTDDFLSALFQRAGFAWQGGFIGGWIAGLWFVKLKKLKFRLMLDLAAPYIALGQAIGRMGCFAEGCCYGKPWDLGVYFPVHHARLHPTQLYETGMLFAIFLILKFVKKPSWPAGRIFVLYLWLAGIERFVVEFYRDDHEILFWGLSLAQCVAAGIFVAGIVMFIRFRK